jgi:cell division protein FtsL
MARRNRPAALMPDPRAPVSTLVVGLLALALLASALALVSAQYRARVLFAELELAQQDAKAFEADGARLRSDLFRAGQPATVEAQARRLGMRPIAPDRIVVLTPPPAKEAAR